MLNEELGLPRFIYGTLAQVVEHLTFNQAVRGSSPRCLTVTQYADMAELADALDLGSSPRGCRFNSCYPQAQGS